MVGRVQAHRLVQVQAGPVQISLHETAATQAVLDRRVLRLVYVVLEVEEGSVERHTCLGRLGSGRVADGATMGKCEVVCVERPFDGAPKTGLPHALRNRKGDERWIVGLRYGHDRDLRLGLQTDPDQTVFHQRGISVVAPVLSAGERQAGGFKGRNAANPSGRTPLESVVTAGDSGPLAVHPAQRESGAAVRACAGHCDNLTL